MVAAACVEVPVVEPLLLEELEDPELLLELLDFELEPLEDFLPCVFLKVLPGELPLAGTRLGLNWLLFGVVVVALVVVVLEDAAVPHPAASAARASIATAAVTRRRLGRNRRRRGRMLGRNVASPGEAVSISTNDTVLADG